MKSSMRRFWELVVALGIPHSRHTRPRETTCPWDGKVLHGISTDHDTFEFDLWHEVGHALVASDAGWKLAGWGQGMVYDGTDGGPLLDHCGVEEDASALGIWLQMFVGRDPEGALNHADCHSWLEVPCQDNPMRRACWYTHLEGMKLYLRRRITARLTRAGYANPWDDTQVPPWAV